METGLALIPPAAIKAKVIEIAGERQAGQSVESSLKNIAEGFSYLGMLGGTGGIIIGIIVMLIGNAVGGSIAIAAGVILLIQGIIMNALFSALAEIIMLLKKSNSIRYTGVISGAQTESFTTLVCSNCRNILGTSQFKKCPYCGVEITDG